MINEIIDLISETLFIKKSDIKPNSQLRDIIKDSMDIVEIIAVLTNTYKISFKLEELKGTETINDLAEYIDKNKNSTEANLETTF